MSENHDTAGLRAQFAGVGQDVPPELLVAIAAVRAAHSSLINGDPEPFGQVYWHDEQATLLGAYGGYERGWPALARRFDLIAPSFDGAGQIVTTTLAVGVGGDLAYTVDLERADPGSSRPDTAPTTLRATHVYRRAGEVWKLIHRHSDTMATPQGPVAQPQR